MNRNIIQSIFSITVMTILSIRAHDYKESYKQAVVVLCMTKEKEITNKESFCKSEEGFEKYKLGANK